MSHDYLANFLFKPFYQENPSAPGTGLGLSIVERLVHFIGGKINVTSEEGVGTEVTVEVSLGRPKDRYENHSPDLALYPVATLGLLGLNPEIDPVKFSASTSPSRSEALLALTSTIARYAAALKTATTSVDSVDYGAADIILIRDSQHRLLEVSRIVALKKPVIVLCMEPLRSQEQTFE
jgi:hypothetical protein